MLKECLKNNNLSITYLSKVMDISRPTLYKLMSIYDSKGTLPEERHQIIFDMICNTEGDSENLISDLDDIKGLIAREKTIGASDLPIQKADLINTFLSRANADLHSDDCDDNIYRLINIIVTSYKTVPAFKMYAKYILVLNSILKTDTIEEDEKPFISNIYKVNSMFNHGTLVTDEENFDRFLRRIEGLKKEKAPILKETQQKIEKELKSKLKDKISAQIEKSLESGVSIENLDYEEIIDNITIE